MQNSTASATARRSSRVPANVPILVTSLEPATHFSEVCETLVVSAHGCSMRSPMKLDAGVLVHFHSKEGRETTAKVVYCQPLESDRLGWRLGAKLDRPENFWGLKACPQDWERLPAPAAPTADKLPLKLLGKNGDAQVIPPSLKLTLDGIQKQISDENLRAMIAELVQPFQAELTDVREKLARGEARRSRFEVSLSQIPPELEEQLEQRLRKHLGPQDSGRGTRSGNTVAGSGESSYRSEDVRYPQSVCPTGHTGTASSRAEDTGSYRRHCSQSARPSQSSARRVPAASCGRRQPAQAAE